MSYWLKTTVSVEEETRRVAREQISKATGDLGADDRHEGVHEFRKRCKKVRALLRLVRPALGDTYSHENECLRDAARELSDLRDATSMIESFDALVDRYDDVIDRDNVAAVRRDLESHRLDLAERQALDRRVAEARKAVEGAAERVESWELDTEGFDAVAGGVAKTYKRARKAMAAARSDPSTAAFHEWRKRAKYHRYHLRLLRDAWEPMLDEMRRQLHLLTDLLGDEHDLAVLRAHLVDASHGAPCAEPRRAVISLIDTCRAELQTLAKPLGRRLFVESTPARVKRLRCWWEARSLEVTLRAALADKAVPR